MTQFLRTLPVVFAALCLVAGGAAQTIVVTGSGIYGQNGRVANGTVTVTPVQTPGGPATAFRLVGGGQYSAQSVSVPIRAGFFSIAVPDVALTIPGNIGFHVVARDNNTGAIVLDDPFVQPSSAPAPSPAATWCSTTGGATTCNFDKYDKTIQVLPLFSAVAGGSPTGQTGAGGAPGPAGPQGAAGAPGPQGVAGLTGATGPSGPAGPQGVAGQNATIAAGTASALAPGATPTVTNAGTATAALLNFGIPSGATGPAGPTGAAGPQGVAGSAGNTGPQGAAGATGPAGPQGPGGAAGATGVAGPQGLQGLTGPAGAAGMSAYALAMAGGFSGSQTQWLASLIGAAGPQGPQGVAGATGPQGVVGPGGATGPQGPAGPTGPSGSGSGGYATTVAATSGALPTAVGACSSPPCILALPPSYPFTADSGTFQGIRFRPIANAHILSYIGGGELHSVTDPTATGSYLAGIGVGVDLQNLAATYEQHALQINHRITAPGANLGNSGVCGAGAWTLFTACPQGWLITKGLAMQIDANAEGITAGIDMNLNKNGAGDVHNYWYVYGQGGFRAPSDEFLQGRALHAGEMGGPVYTATVASSSGYILTTTPVTGTRTQGVGRMLIDTTAPVASGCVTAQGQLGSLPVSTFTLGCGAAALTPSTAYGTLATAAPNVPYIYSTGANTLTTSTQLTVNLIAGAFRVGDLAVFAGSYHETASVLAVQAASGGTQLVTFALRRTHPVGDIVMQSSFGAGGLELLANDGDGFRYVLDVLGAVSSTQIAAVAQTGGAALVGLGNTNVVLSQFPTTNDTITNTGGVVSFILYDSDVNGHAQLQNFPQITIANAANAAFNGLCTNLTVTALHYPSTATCTQAASAGQTSAGPATISLGDTGYGNTRFRLFAMAQVLDVQNLAAAGDVLDGTLRLEPFSSSFFANGHTVEEPHDSSAGFVASAIGFGFSNIYAAPNSAIEDPGVGGAGINGLVHARYTKYVNPCAMYAGCGGLLTAPHGYQVGGTANDFGGMDNAPWPAGSAFTHAGCDPLSYNCSDPKYHYSVFQGRGYQPVSGRDHGLALDYNPYSGRYDTSVTHTTFSQIPSTTSPVSGACFINDPQTGLAIELASCPLSAGVSVADVQSTTPTSGNPIAATSCGATVTVTMPNMLTTSVFTARPSTDVSGTTGWTPSDAVYIHTWPTAGHGNYKLCNRGSSPASPAAIVLNLGAQ